MANRLEAATQVRSVHDDGGARRSVAVGFRPEIQGLRAVAVLLVAAYHVWFGRVSGGVDVFLLLTGFLLTSSLLRSAERTGRVRFLKFWARLARRLFPTVAVVLMGILVLTYLWLPEARWQDTLAEVIASAFYVENWQLALNSVDYLAEGNVPSPLQHFWSLSIQGQFYLILPILVTIAALARMRTTRALFGLMAAIFVVSLAYSVYMTGTDQPWAYFDTGARLWEFALGGMFAIALPYLNLPLRMRIAAGWIGLAGLVSCGLLLQVSTVFPGWIALWPTGSAVLIILAGTTGNKFAADRLLTTKVLDYFGTISYALYLWHWPVLVVYLTVTEQDAVGWRGGAAILAVSVALAHVTTRVVETGLAGFGNRIRTSLAIALPGLLLAAGCAGGWLGYLAYQDDRLQEQSNDAASYPGAAALHDDRPLPDVPMAPTSSGAKWDLPAIVADGCQQKKTETEVLVCTYGDPNGDRTVALAGSSLAAHWFPALNKAATANGWKLVTVIKSGCALAVGDQSEYEPACVQWQPGAIAKLLELKPDLVVTQGTRTTSQHGESIPPGYPGVWDAFADADVKVLALRDTPRQGYVAPECVEREGPAECVTDTDASMAPSPPYAKVDAPSNVTFVDLTSYFCRQDGRCPAVVGNVMVYRDRSHMTATYSRTLAEPLAREVQKAFGG